MKDLKFDQTPDYNYLHELFKQGLLILTENAIFVDTKQVLYYIYFRNLMLLMNITVIL